MGDQEIKSEIKNMAERVNRRSNFINFLVPSTNGACFAVLPYLLPTAIRQSNEPNRGIKFGDLEGELSDSAIKSAQLGFYAGWVVGGTANVLQAYIYSYLAFNEHPEALLIPVATNVLSGIYEIGRKMFSRTRASK
ncbi:MAG: hypothetical protein Q7S27_02720 [Nanoarchaeota archaeon]|nr:hypothetical protein [Nanoarchaeota archaeon]